MISYSTHTHTHTTHTTHNTRTTLTHTGEDAQDAAEETWYRRSATTLEAFLQMSTVGEYEARLQLLSSFHSHLQVSRAVWLRTLSMT